MPEDSRLEGIQIAFASGAMPGDEIRLRGLWGREQLSRLFEFDLVLSREAGPFTNDELDSLLKAPCAVAMGPEEGDVVHGILASIELIDAARTEAARYLARMVPNAWLMTMSRTNRAFQDKTAPAMIEELLVGYGLQKGADFDILVTGKSPTREFVVQFEESDWDFLQRWLEHEGFFYWFEHRSGGEKLVIADANEDATPIAEPRNISHRERNNLSTGGLATVWDWNLRQRRIPARVVLADYNHRSPHIPLMAKADVDTQRGFGSVFLYGQHFKDVDEGSALAKLRAERLLCERRTYTGRTDCSRLRVGHTFVLENHHDAANDGAYLITSVEHRVGYPVGVDDDGAAPQRYLAKFTAIPIDVPFRPERVTPWPSINGVINAHIDSDSEGAQAQMDEQGRYKVRLPFDTFGAKGSKSSRWVRMAQPYTGVGHGSHFPLRKGTEVLLAHVGGDPDRPIIVGTVPHARTPGPTNSKNPTQSVIQTASGIRIEMEDHQP